MGGNFDVGETVYARWPGSTLFYKATVLKMDGNVASLKFENEDESNEIPIKDIYKEGVFTQRSRSKSPARKTSRSRSKTRQRRRSKSPARKKSSSPKKIRQPRSPARRASPVLSEEIKTAAVAVERVPSERSINEISGVYTIVSKQSPNLLQQTPDIETIASSDEHVHARRSNISKEQVTMTRRATRSTTHALETEQKPQDQLLKEEKLKCTILGKLSCTGCCISSFVASVAAILLPILILYGLHLSCGSKTSCALFKIPKLPSLEMLFNWKEVGFMFGWFGFQALLSLMPIGKVAVGPTLGNHARLLYRLNGLPSFVVSVAAFVGAYYYGVFSKKFFSLNYLRFMTGANLFALVVSCIVWFTTRKTSTTSTGMMNDFIYGRVISPRICAFDFKMYSFKAGFITWGVVNLCYLNKEIQSIGLSTVMKTNLSLVLLVGFQTWYIVDLFLFEESLLYTASLSSEDFGYLALSGMTVWIPFFCTMQSRYLSLYPVSLPWYCYAIPIVMQVIGYFIYRVSMQQKFLFRKDQHATKLAGIDYITTSDRKNLLVDGYWKRLRHPNYFGDLLMNISWSALCGFNHPICWIWSVALIPLFVWMCIKDDAKCLQKYGASWEEYKRRVKYRMIPYVY